MRALAHKELQREQANVLAFAEPRRELEELPEGLETGFVKRRKRGARTDEDCINEICELIAQGITATASTRYVGLPWATWQSWLKKNHQDAREKFEFAYTAHLEVMADNTIRIYEQLKAEREAAMKEFHEAHGRNAALPDVPTLAEQGFADTSADNWYGLLAPARTPLVVVAKLHDAVVAALEAPDVREKLVASGAIPAPMSSAEFGALLNDELVRWGRVVRDKNIKED
jgi:hypothetical protein